MGSLIFDHEGGVRLVIFSICTDFFRDQKVSMNNTLLQLNGKTFPFFLPTMRRISVCLNA